jgi:hypothetical protein
MFRKEQALKDHSRGSCAVVRTVLVQYVHRGGSTISETPCSFALVVVPAHDAKNN